MEWISFIKEQPKEGQNVEVGQMNEKGEIENVIPMKYFYQINRYYFDTHWKPLKK